MYVILFFVLGIFLSFADDRECLPPGQTHLENKLNQSFHLDRGERELREWLSHPKNTAIKQELKEIDRQKKFAFRLKEEELTSLSQTKIEQAILNNDRPSLIENFPEKGSNSQISAKDGSISIEMSSLSKQELDVLPKEVLDKLDSKIKINYMYPYDKYEYFLTYGGRELPMKKALNQIQTDYEDACLLKDVVNKRSSKTAASLESSGVKAAN